MDIPTSIYIRNFYLTLFELINTPNHIGGIQYSISVFTNTETDHSIHELRVYAQANNASVFHYRDSSGLEVNSIVQKFNRCTTYPNTPAHFFHLYNSEKLYSLLYYRPVWDNYP